MPIWQNAIKLSVRPEAGKTHAAACLPAMPLDQLLTGRPLADIPRTLGLLHSLSPQSHVTAARAAIAVASGTRHAPTPETQVGLVREQAREHGVYFLVTLPEALGLAPDAALATHIARITGAHDRGMLASCLLELLQAMSGTGTMDAPGKNPAAPSGHVGRLMPELAARLPKGAPQHVADAALARRWEAFRALPRLLAAKHWHDLWMGGASGAGWACLPSARGLLVHRLKLKHGELSSYALDTPTMRHFATTGPWVQAMESAVFQDAAPARAAGALLAAVLDPCLPFVLTAPSLTAAPGS